MVVVTRSQAKKMASGHPEKLGPIAAELSKRLEKVDFENPHTQHSDIDDDYDGGLEYSPRASTPSGVRPKEQKPRLEDLRPVGGDSTAKLTAKLNDAIDRLTTVEIDLVALDRQHRALKEDQAGTMDMFREINRRLVALEESNIRLTAENGVL